MSFLDRHAPRMRRRSLCLAASSLLALSCGGGGDLTGTGSNNSGGGTAAQASSVGVAPDTATVPVGSTRQLTATPRDAAGAALTGRTVTWASSNAAVASVSAGLVTAIAGGTATITATADGKAGTATITVPAAVATVTVSPSTASLLVGGTQQLAATTRDASGATLTGRAIAWSSSNTSVATVNTATGLVTAVGSGSATITATSETRSGAAAIGVSAVVGNGMVSANGTENCAITVAGAAYCWGRVFGTVADTLRREGKYPKAVPGGHVFKDIATGWDHACALTSDGTAWCWGVNWQNIYGSTIDGTLVETPVAVPGGLRFASIQAGARFTVGLTAEGKAYAWGDNSLGALGDGTTTNRFSPVAVAGTRIFKSIHTSRFGIVALGVDGLPWSWGQVWDGSRTNVPTRFSDTLKLASISLSESNAVALDSLGRAYIWRNREIKEFPQRDATGFTFAQVRAGHGFQIGLTAAGKAYGWGNNALGTLGDGTTTDRFGGPVAVIGGHTFRTITTGSAHTIALTDAGVAYAWGTNQDWQFGNGGNDFIVHTPAAPSVSEFTLDVAPSSVTLDAGKSVDLAVSVTRRGGGFTTDGKGIGLPGAVNLALSPMPAGVTGALSPSTIPAGQPSASLRLTAASDAAGGPATVSIRGTASGFPERSIDASVLVVSSSGSTGLNLVCTSGSTPSSFPPGYHCMTNSAGQHVTGQFAVATLTGSPWWVDETAEVCVSWRNENNRGLSTARFKAGVGGGATTVTTGQWGLVVRSSGVPEGQPNARPLFTSNLDAQTQLLSYNSTLSDNVINNYAFMRRSSCPW